MPRHRVISRIALAGAVALATAVGGCSNQAQVFDTSNWFSKPANVFAKPDWARPVDANTTDLGPKGPIGPNDLVGADGICAPAEAPQAAAPPPAPATTASADAGEGPPGALQPGAPPVLSGIALGMSECDAVRRAGQPSNVAISAGDKGERKVVLTYLSGPWPGIYTFSSGRLKVVDRAPEQPKLTPKKKTPKRAKSAAHQTPERTYVQ